MIPYGLKFRRPYRTATGTLERREMVLLRIKDKDGLIGLGEAVPLSLRGGTGINQVVDELVAWGDDPSGAAPTTAPARCAVDTALADLEARREGIPLWKLLDGSGSVRALQCNATITSGVLTDVLAQCDGWAQEGFNVFKLKAGPSDAVATVAAVRATLGPEAQIRIDANGTWGRDAPRILDELEPFGIELVEEPVVGLVDMAALSRRSSIPLVADESVNDRGQAAEASVLGACVAATVKLSKIGGLEVDLGGHLPTYLSSALDGPVGIAAAAHAGQTLDPDSPWSNVAHGLATERLFETTICNEGALLDGATLLPPIGAGLGITIDEDALKAVRL